MHLLGFINQEDTDLLFLIRVPQIGFELIQTRFSIPALAALAKGFQNFFDHLKNRWTMLSRFNHGDIKVPVAVHQAKQPAHNGRFAGALLADN